MRTLTDAKIVRETEKAIRVEITMLAWDVVRWKIWLPKSQITINSDGSISVPGWLLENKVIELNNYFATCPPYRQSGTVAFIYNEDIIGKK